MRPQYNDYLRVYVGDGEIISNRIETLNDEEGRQKVDLNDVFDKQTRNIEFYQSIKKQHLGEEEEMSTEQLNAYIKYFEDCRKNNIKRVINPRLILFFNRSYHLFNQIVQAE